MIVTFIAANGLQASPSYVAVNTILRRQPAASLVAIATDNLSVCPFTHIITF
jgi:hypothetical protein